MNDTVIMPKRPILRYHGGKWKLAPWIIEHFPAHKVYVEPFGGGGSVLIRKPRAFAEIYGEIDGDVVNVFKVLRDPEAAAELQRVLELTPFAREEFTAAYLPAIDPVERARRVIVRSFMGFGSASVHRIHTTGFRSKSMRSGSTPAHDWVKWPWQVPAFVERLQGVVIENRDALDTIRRHDGPGVLFYIDPPYVLSTRGNARGVRQKYPEELTDQDHRTLAELLHCVRGMVALSGYPCTLYDEDLYSDWRRVEKKHFADGARPRMEVLWLNSACAEALERDRAQGRPVA